jgi:outer membrane protein OmpA-like peptidoglycan-associated protein
MQILLKSNLQIYGYCDDRGSAEYNYRLSKDRVNTVLTTLTTHGFDKNKIIILKEEGVILKNGLVFNETAQK